MLEALDTRLEEVGLMVPLDLGAKVPHLHLHLHPHLHLFQVLVWSLVTCLSRRSLPGQQVGQAEPR